MADSQDKVLTDSKYEAIQTTCRHLHLPQMQVQPRIYTHPNIIYHEEKCKVEETLHDFKHMLREVLKQDEHLEDASELLITYVAKYHNRSSKLGYLKYCYSCKSFDDCKH